MAERLLVLRLQPMCSGCGQYISQDDEIVYRCTGTCCTAESNHGRRRKSSLSVKQADLWTGGSTSSPVVSAKHLIPSCAYFCRSCCRGTNKQKLAQRNNHDGPLQAVKLVSKKKKTKHSIRDLESHRGRQIDISRILRWKSSSVRHAQTCQVLFHAGSSHVISESQKCREKRSFDIAMFVVCPL